MRIVLLIIILISIRGLSYGQDTINIIGQIFDVWSPLSNPNDTIKGRQDPKLLEMLNLYSDKKELMTQIMSVFPDYKGMEKIKRKDRILKKKTMDDIIFSYDFGKLNEYNMMLRPGFTIHDGHNQHFVKCTKRQQEQVKESEMNDLKNEKPLTQYEFRLLYVGEYGFGGIKCFSLIDYKIIEDK